MKILIDESLPRYLKQPLGTHQVSTVQEMRWTGIKVALQLREITPFGQTPRFLIGDRDRKYGQTFKRVATRSGIEILRTPYGTPKTIAIVALD